MLAGPWEEKIVLRSNKDPLTKNQSMSWHCSQNNPTAQVGAAACFGRHRGGLSATTAAVADALARRSPPPIRHPRHLGVACVPGG